MKILLFNDNPVVRKLVALSAQKTKDELSVIWSVDEIQESEYDLLIMDDALYSAETFESLKELITFKSTLLMATRSQAVPAGFDNVINKPFLPTDLVDMFIQIDKKIATVPATPASAEKEEPVHADDLVNAINLEETLPEWGATEEDGFESFDLGDLEDEIDLSDDEISDDLLDDLELAVPSTTILDKEEVQEVQNLLDDTESDDWDLEDEIIIKGINEADITPAETKEELFDELEIPEEELGDSEEETEAFDLNDEMILPDIDNDLILDDQELDELESQIEDAVSALETEALDEELELDDLAFDLDDGLMEELNLSENDIAETDEFGSLDELDMLDERELKLAIGEEIDEDTLGREEEELSPSVEVDNEESAEPYLNENAAQESVNTVTTTHAEGVEALQALLKALANEDVAKSLKGMNISININFGNGS